MNKNDWDYLKFRVLALALIAGSGVLTVILVWLFVKELL